MGKKEDEGLNQEARNSVIIMFLVGLAYGGIVGWYYGKAAGEKAVYEQQADNALKNRMWELESAITSLAMQASEREAANGSAS
jgi:hypothetical protein